MKSRFILYRRKLGGMFYIEDTQIKTGKPGHKDSRRGRHPAPRPQ
jgi:hypothetical protein